MYTYIDPNAQAAPGGVTNDQAKMAGLQQQEAAMIRSYKHMKSTNLAISGKNPFVERGLEGATWKFGTGGDWTVDTGIPIDNKYLLSGMIATGDQIGDSVRGIKQLLQEHGLADDLIDQQAQNDNEQILRQLYGDEIYGGAAKTGGAVGAFAEPVGYLTLGAGKLKKTSDAIMASVGVGAVYGSTMYIDGNESRLMNAGIVAGMMGVGGGVAAKYFNQAAGDVLPRRFAAAKKAELAEEAAAGVDNAVDPFIMKEVFPGYEVAEGAVETITMKGGVKAQATQARKAAERAAKKAAKAEKNPIAKSSDEVLEEIAVRSSVEGGRHAKHNQYKELVNSVIQPVVDQIGTYSKAVAAKLRVADGIQHVRQHNWSQKVKPWQDFIRGLDDVNKTQLKKLLSNGGFNKATMNFIRQSGGAEGVAQAQAVKTVLADILKRYKDVGYKIDGRADYFPLAVKDLAGLRAKEQGTLDALYSKAQAAQKGKPLTTNQKAHIDEHYFTFDQRYSNTSGSLKARRKEGVTDDQLQYYQDPMEALHFYMHTASEDIAKREFFKGFGYKPKKDGLNATGTDIDDSITSLVDRIKADVPGHAEQQELVRLLRSRFSADVHKTHKAVTNLKNISYATTLGNFWSAMTQFGDLVFSFHKYGIKNTISSIFSASTYGKEGGARFHLGIEKAMQELQSEQQGITSKLADFAFKWSGFDKVDRFGKNVNINAALRSNRKLALQNEQKFIEKYSDHFGDQTQALANELQNLKLGKGAIGEGSENLKLMLWNELADTQPIGLSEMPAKYLAHPNGRIFYAYKTFSLKQLNYMRANIAKNPNKFAAGYDTAKFATMFVLANSGIDGLKEFLKGDIDAFDFDEALQDNLVSMVGTSKWAVDKSSGLGDIILQAMAPVPITQAGKALNIPGFGKPTGEVASNLMNEVPIVGALKKNWMDE